jgi:hypothetical protein
MQASPEIRYNADGAKTATLEPLILPLRVQVRAPNYQAAIREARKVIDELAEEVARFTLKGAALKMGDFGQRYQQKAAGLILEQQSSNEVRLELDFYLLLTFEVRERFWERAELIARHIDFVQEFCQRPRGKQVIVTPEEARFLTEGTTGLPARRDASA